MARRQAVPPMTRYLVLGSSKLLLLGLARRRTPRTPLDLGASVTAVQAKTSSSCKMCLVPSLPFFSSSCSILCTRSLPNRCEKGLNVVCFGIARCVFAPALHIFPPFQLSEYFAASIAFPLVSAFVLHVRIGCVAIVNLCCTAYLALSCRA